MEMSPSGSTSWRLSSSSEDVGTRDDEREAYPACSSTSAKSPSWSSERRPRQLSWTMLKRGMWPPLRVQIHEPHGRTPAFIKLIVVYIILLFTKIVKLCISPTSVLPRGFEPLTLAGQRPKRCAYANSATGALLSISALFYKDLQHFPSLSQTLTYCQ